MAIESILISAVSFGILVFATLLAGHLTLEPPRRFAPLPRPRRRSLPRQLLHERHSSWNRSE